MKYKQVKAFLIASALAASTIAMAGCGKQENTQVSVSAEAEQAAAYRFTGNDLEGYITGLEDRTALMGTDINTWFSGIQADKSVVRSVTVNASEVDAATAGEYPVEYIVTVDAEALQEIVDEKEAAEEAENASEETDNNTDTSEGADTSETGEVSGETTAASDTASAEGTADGTDVSAEEAAITLEDITAVVDLTGDTEGDSGVSDGDADSSTLSSTEPEISDYTPYDITFTRTVTVVDEAQAATLNGSGTYVEGYSTGEHPVENTDAVTGDASSDASADTASNGTDNTGGTSSSTSSGSSNSSGNSSTGNSNRNNSSSGSSSSGSHSSSSGSSSSSSSGSSGGSSGSSDSSGSSSSSSSGGSSSSSSQQATHTHNWVAQYTTVHHDAVTERKWVQDTPDHTVFVCNKCKKEFSSSSEVSLHLFDCGSGGYSPKVIKGDGHYETVTVQEAYDEQVLSGYKCSTCGATR